MCTLLRHEVIVAVSAKISYWGVSCHPSRLCSALDGPPCRGVSYVTKLLYLEPHPPCVDFIIVRLKEIIPKFYPLFYSFIPNGFNQSSHLIFSM